MTPSPTRCFLIRHGETEWSRDRRHTGRTDLPLLAGAAARLGVVRRVLGGRRPAAVFTSPLERARDTVALLGWAGSAVVDEDLAEWDYGEYEGMTTEEIRRSRPGWSLFADGAPGGESLEEVTRRVDRVLARVRAVPGEVACVAHAHLLRVMAARWIGLDGAGGRHFVLGAGSLSELGWEREQPVVVSWNLR
ncbi:MAG TPA: histidine phosphatase family protein [Acidimicrobiales bacterium]|nr:histidine phosphatase family protein [Acidimicrobiales bacterium]